MNNIVVLFASDLFRGGVAFSASKLSTLLTEKGFSTAVVTYENLPVRYFAKTALGTSTLNCPYSRTSHKGALKQFFVRSMRYPYVLVAAWRFSRALAALERSSRNSEKLTVVAFTHAPIVAASFVKLFRPSRIRLIVSERQDPSKDLRNRLLRGILSWAYSNADLIHVNSPALPEILKREFGVTNTKTTLVPNVIEAASADTLAKTSMSLRQGIEKRQIRAIAIGRLAPQKALYLAPYILAHLQREGFQISLDIVGDGDPQIIQEIAENAASLGISENVRFIGEHKDFRDKLGNYNLGLFLSNWESFGNVLGEYLAAGIITIASSTEAGLINYLTDGQHCLKIPIVGRENAAVSSEPMLAAQRLADLFNNEEKALKLRAQALQAAEQFSAEKHAARFSEILFAS
ncbi:glycosyltransferase family 4 protein [Pelagibacterium lacus]|uniref:Glycosyltransferase n=1 Tax=Pelagibacterium lacus TaxID=2282655 RepID=A0A369VZ12_9HYPH|nr:glycosyltransferase family 4 protein [Pelagibacterium lacus]RDE07636.1 glycosyltransferase [Pelagibacterium lacus]